MLNNWIKNGLNIMEENIVHDKKVTTVDLLKHFIDSEQKYKTRWNYYHVILCIGVWGILACTLWGVFIGWK